MRTPCWFEKQAARVTIAVLVHTDLAVYFRDMTEADGPTQIVSQTMMPELGCIFCQHLSNDRVECRCRGRTAT